MVSEPLARLVAEEATVPREIFLTYQVHSETIVTPENIDAIRAAVSGTEPDAVALIALTDVTLGIRDELVASPTGVSAGR